jgi:putative membrane protein
LELTVTASNLPDAHDPRVLLAEERSNLAWLRTALGVMGFGFVLAKFDLFLRIVSAQPTGLVIVRHLPYWLGASMVLLGAVISVLIGWEHRRVFATRDALGYLPRYRIVLGIGLAWFLALMGLAMLLYLGLVTEPEPGSVGAG